MHHSAPPELRSAAFAYLDQLVAKPTSLSRAGSIHADTLPGMPSWLTPAAGLAQAAGIDCRRLRESLTKLEITFANSPALEPSVRDLLDARALELATAASRVMRARCEEDPRAEDRLKTLATRRLGELAEITGIADGWGTARALLTSRETMVSTEQMRTALIDEHYARVNQRRRRKACNEAVGQTTEQPVPAEIPQRAEAATEDRT
ncbi:hypothetical protein ACWC1D_00920 [Streptomyces sp. NPDC001478]